MTNVCHNIKKFPPKEREKSLSSLWQSDDIWGENYEIEIIWLSFLPVLDFFPFCLKEQRYLEIHKAASAKRTDRQHSLNFNSPFQLQRAWSEKKGSYFQPSPLVKTTKS